MTETIIAGLQLVEQGDTHAIFERRFAAPPAALWRAHTEPKLLQRWCTGPEGGAMPVCRIDPRAGGSFHYEFTMGDYRFTIEADIEIAEPPRRMVHVERMHLPQPDGSVMDTPGCRVETLFLANGAGTLMRMRMDLPSAEALKAMLATGMAAGMEASYARLETLGL